MNKLFTKKSRTEFAIKVIESLNNANLVVPEQADNPRTVGDAVQDFLAENFKNYFQPNVLKEYNSSFSRRSLEDFAFIDNEDNYYAVDCKTHNVDTVFNMPNLISVERLAHFYEVNNNYFTVLINSYSVSSEGKLIFKECIFSPIEMLDWNCLTIGALGWGQIQIANASRIDIDETSTRKKWMLKLCDYLDIFYPKEISKITHRIDRFKKVREFWESQPD